MNKGLIYAIGAFLLWGILPIYLKQIPSYTALEVTTYRILFSLLILIAIQFFTYGKESFLKLVFPAFKRPILYLSSFLIGINWFLFVYAVENNMIIEASFGYFSGPLINIVFGVFLFKEKMTKIKKLAVFIAILAVATQTLLLQSFPWLALIIGSTFSLYGLIKKISKLPALSSLLIETAIITSVSSFYLLFYAPTQWQNISFTENAFLLASGVISITPLFLFSKAAPLLNFITLGFLQYIAPTLQFLTGVIIYGETLNKYKALSFILIIISCLLVTITGRKSNEGK